ncbi:pimeloyl-ACP methyl ester carboxylesterase [Variovorax paradoxus]|uniref:alpha/beta fold hydrolase n=1 Tax=Variovorax paradoxus TaxID=34073 RepID=UPI002791E0BC|nr:alpha/beta hydrolase [Variovorax paradoxus]MDQ0571821.1 pimeloyl-ACP methyl ester carboxylesterase [Variovorax paradoxus]
MHIVLGVAAFAAFLVLAGVVYERLGQYRAARDFPPAGQMVDIGGRRIQLDCRGAGSPTVVFEAGLSVEGSLSWSAVQPKIDAHTRACAYSRAGLMWSDSSSAPHSAKQVVQDLHAALTNAGERGPFVLVGQSLGALYAMDFTRYFGPDVAGLVFVDPSHPDQVERVADFMTESRSMLSRVGVALAWTGVLRAAAPVLLPRPPQRTASDAQAMRAIWAYAPRSLTTQLAESDSTDSTLAETRGFRELGNRPLVVLTAMAPYTTAELRGMKITPEQGRQVQVIWKQLHEEEVTWSSRSSHRVLPNSGHNIQLEDPDAVIEAVLSVVRAVRAGGPAEAP